MQEYSPLNSYGSVAGEGEYGPPTTPAASAASVPTIGDMPAGEGEEGASQEDTEARRKAILSCTADLFKVISEVLGDPRKMTEEWAKAAKALREAGHPAALLLPSAAGLSNIASTEGDCNLSFLSMSGLLSVTFLLLASDESEGSENPKNPRPESPRSYNEEPSGLFSDETMMAINAINIAVSSILGLSSLVEGETYWWRLMLGSLLDDIAYHMYLKYGRRFGGWPSSLFTAGALTKVAALKGLTSGKAGVGSVSLLAPSLQPLSGENHFSITADGEITYGSILLVPRTYTGPGFIIRHRAPNNPQHTEITDGQKFWVIHVNQQPHVLAQFPPIRRVRKIIGDFIGLMQFLEGRGDDYWGMPPSVIEGVNQSGKRPIVGISSLASAGRLGPYTWDTALLPGPLRRIDAISSKIVSMCSGGEVSDSEPSVDDVRVLFISPAQRLAVARDLAGGTHR